MTRSLRILGVIALLLVGAGKVAARDRASDGRLVAQDDGTVQVTDAARAAGLRFDPSVAPGDRAWILAAIQQARPEAARLLAEVDGLVQVGTMSEGTDILGLTRGDSNGFRVDFDIARLNGDRGMDRATVVLHEFGHVIDFALVPAEVNAALDEQIPRGGPCGLAINCDMPEERFADTFAKWALRGAVSEVGAGYGIAMPASIEGWGAPLAELARGLPAA